MTTDLFGNALTPPAPFPLNLWQKRHATILYHYASLDYLKGLVAKIDAVLQFLDPTLDLAQQQGRDRVLTNDRWGTRDTSANFSTYGWPYLSSFRQGVLEDIAQRRFEIYGRTDAQNAAGGLREISMDWTTPEEYATYEKLWDEAYSYASEIDATLDASSARWKDSSLTQTWLEIGHQFARLPLYRVRTDIEVHTGQKPPRTGVYVPADVPHGAMRFGWTGGKYNEMTECACFNDIGLDAMNTVGRNDLWVDDKKMFDYVRNGRYASFFSPK